MAAQQDHSHEGVFSSSIDLENGLPEFGFTRRAPHAPVVACDCQLERIEQGEVTRFPKRKRRRL
jgi:hypothetical protein